MHKKKVIDQISRTVGMRASRHQFQPAPSSSSSPSTSSLAASALPPPPNPKIIQNMPRKPKPKTTTQAPNGSQEDPYPLFAAPSPDQCLSVRDSLLSLHGFPAEFAEYRRIRHGAGPQSESILDGLVITLLSQNTTDSNSRKAFQRLKSAFPTWNHVLDGESDVLEDAIRCGGLARTKAGRIKSILKTLKEKKGGLCLEYLRGLEIDHVKAELSQFKGIGPKTVRVRSKY